MSSAVWTASSTPESTTSSAPTPSLSTSRAPSRAASTISARRTRRTAPAREQDIQQQALAAELWRSHHARVATHAARFGEAGERRTSSAIREVLGLTIGVSSACPTLPDIYCVLFDYEQFGVTYRVGPQQRSRL
ncbi:hypothetical protein ACKVWC_011310 [Pyricularia oryzae]